jgi:predicted nucleotidyltransferase
MDERAQALIDDLREELPRVLGDRLSGLYLYGSLVLGDFDPDISDVDFLAVLSSPPEEADLPRLEQMHRELEERQPFWNGRVEVAYVSSSALKSFRSESSKIAKISPGEPLHLIDAGREWLVNWYVIREQGVALLGPAPDAFIDPISFEEFRLTVKAHAQSWRDGVHEATERPAQAYAILTMCRALYAWQMGEQVSKAQAAAWAERQLPEWAPVIRDAVQWRQNYRDKDVDHDATLPAAVGFVNAVADRIAAG